MAALTALSLSVAAILIVVTSAFLRLLYVLPSRRRSSSQHHKKSKAEQSHMVIVLGSGGHTAEMMSLLRDTDPTRYKHRSYIVSVGDSFSSSKARDCEQVIQSKHRSTSKSTEDGEIDPLTGVWEVIVVPRAREIHQPLWTAPISSLWCLIGSLRALKTISRTSTIARAQYPDVIITNGPATAVIFILASFILKFLGVAPLWKMQTLYVESWARISTLSLSGKVLLWTGICDRFLVQWEELAKKSNRGRERVEWIGFLVH